MIRHIHIAFYSIIVAAGTACAQPTDTSSIARYEAIARAVMNEGLAGYHGHEILKDLCLSVGQRLSGSEGAKRGVDWAVATMKQLGFENVHTEPVMVPVWRRGRPETAAIVSESGTIEKAFSICALGSSVPTPDDGITANVIEVKSLSEVERLGSAVKGKIVFFNRPLDRTKINTFEAYGGAVDQRAQGASAAAKHGAAAVIVRSMTTTIDDNPHTGTVNYIDTLPKIPAAAISTAGAEELSKRLKTDPSLKFSLALHCTTLADAQSFNVIGDLRGRKFPEQIVLASGHFDSWDLGQGAHDDGAGCVHAIEALRILKALNLRARRTMRVVLFMNEENGLRGGLAYPGINRGNEKHIVALESDMGGFAPRSFVFSGSERQLTSLKRWEYLLRPLDGIRIEGGGVGGDITPLMQTGVPGIGLHVDQQRYFEYHHAGTDRIEAVNERELEFGACAVAILLYMIAEEGL